MTMGVASFLNKWNRIHPFEVYCPVVFSILPKLCNQHHQVQSTFITPKRNPWACLPISLAATPWPPLTYLVFLWTGPVWIFLLNRIMYYLAFCVWILSLGVMSSRLIHVAAGFSISFLWLHYLHYMAIPYSVNPFINWRTYGLFPLLGYYGH